MSVRRFYDPVVVVKAARGMMPGGSMIAYDHTRKVYKIWRENANLGQRTLEEVNRYTNPARVLASVARRAIVEQVRR